MTMKRQHPIKSLLNFRTLTAEVVLSTSTHIFTEIYNNPNYTPPQAPAPPVDPATLKSANDSLAAVGQRWCSGRLDDSGNRQDHQVAVDHLRFEAGHDLCFSGSCGEEGRWLLRLE